MTDTDHMGYRTDSLGNVTEYTCDDCHAWTPVINIKNIGELADWFCCPACYAKRKQVTSKEPS